MEAGIAPQQFWNMSAAEIQEAVEGYRKRMQWQAILTYILPGLIGSALSDKHYPSIQKVFPQLFDDLPEPVSKPAWQIWKERVLAHREDYKRDRGDKS